MYKIEKGFENSNVSAVINDGRKLFKGLFKDATQEELEQMHFTGVPHIIKLNSKPIVKTRDNDPNAAHVVVPPKKKRKKKANGVQKETTKNDSKKDME